MTVPATSGWYYVHTHNDGIHPAWWSKDGKYLVSQARHIKLEDFKKAGVRIGAPVPIPGDIP